MYIADCIFGHHLCGLFHSGGKTGQSPIDFLSCRQTRLRPRILYGRQCLQINAALSAKLAFCLNGYSKFHVNPSIGFQDISPKNHLNFAALVEKSKDHRSSLAFELWARWITVPNFMAIHLKWWTDQ